MKNGKACEMVSNSWMMTLAEMNLRRPKIQEEVPREREQIDFEKIVQTENEGSFSKEKH